jgi:hypothetical protein
MNKEYMTMKSWLMDATRYRIETGRKLSWSTFSKLLYKFSLTDGDNSFTMSIFKINDDYKKSSSDLIRDLFSPIIGRDILLRVINDVEFSNLNSGSFDQELKIAKAELDKLKIFE